MLGLKCGDPEHGDLSNALRDEKHFLAVPAGDNVVRMLPPLTVTERKSARVSSGSRAAAAKLSKTKAGSSIMSALPGILPICAFRQRSAHDPRRCARCASPR
jgi:hypothetical protein